MGNPIGLLQEMCMSRRWPPPTYETELEVGLPHERQFTISCSVLKYHEVGQGKSKKIAKRIAAYKMWTRLQESPLDQNQINQIIDEEGNEEVILSFSYSFLLLVLLLSIMFLNPVCFWFFCVIYCEKISLVLSIKNREIHKKLNMFIKC